VKDFGFYFSFNSGLLYLGGQGGGAHGRMEDKNKST
jgi:hypothetical protein